MSWENRASEDGNMAPLALGACLVAVAAFGMVVDFATLHEAKQGQELALDAARAYCMDALGAASAKYAQDPAAELSDAIVDQVRSQGIDDAVSIWFYEAPEQAVPETERAWAIGVQIEGRRALPFSAGGDLGAADVASSRVFTARPYAAERVWRPDRRICGVRRYESGASAGQGSFSAIGTLDGFPEEVAQAARSLMAQG